MKIFVLFVGLLMCLSSQAAEVELQKADQIAREIAAWFTYTTGPIVSEHQGQCGDYAVMFILKYNASVGMNAARLVTTNNPITSGTYRIGEKTDIGKLGFHGFSSGSSGFLSWKGQLYIFHPQIRR